MNNSARSFSALNPDHFRKCGRANEEPYCTIANRNLVLSVKITETQRRTKVCKSMIHESFVLSWEKVMRGQFLGDILGRTP